MPVMCVLFPRLPIVLAHAQRPQFVGRSVVLASGAGDDALVTAVSSPAARESIVPGMTAAEARRLSPSTVFLPDNPGACLEALEHAATLVRSRFTTRVEIGGRDHIFLQLPGRADATETLASAIVAYLAAFTGHDLRASIASSRAAALTAARCARNGVAIDTTPAASHEPPIRPFRDETIAASVRLSLEAPVARQLQALCRRLASLLAARDEGTRSLHITIGQTADQAVHLRDPLYTATALYDAIAPHALDARPGESLTVSLGALAPDLRVRPYTLGPASLPVRPARRLQPLFAHGSPLRAAS